MVSKKQVKQVLGGLPWMAELYWQLRQPGKPLSKSFSLSKVENALPQWLTQAGEARQKHLASATPKKRLLLFLTLRYWIEHGALLSTALAGLGHEVSLAFLPYANYRKPMTNFDVRRQNLYARHVLEKAAPLVRVVPVLDIKNIRSNHTKGNLLPDELAKNIHQVALRDVQYTLQIEEFDLDDESSAAGLLYRMRIERNMQAAQAMFYGLKSNPVDVVLTPNGSILENGAVFQVARFLDIPITTYEFGEQRQRIWLAQNREVMRQETDDLWQSRKTIALSDDQLGKVRDLFASRQQAGLWENFSRRWQGLPSQGGGQVRQQLGLDDRPVVLLAANVIGDSLTLGRQVFSQSMTDWLQQTLRFFAGLNKVQLVVRIHPGERYTKGPSVSDVVSQVLPELPENIHLVAADDPINTYDLVEIASLGLVYTTTTGMEMAMSGVPVIVSGQTHYRGKGFTFDPVSWDDFYEQIEKLLTLDTIGRLTKEQVQQAWNYAYRFFFEYPCAFPWHLLYFWDELDDLPIKYVLSDEGQAQYGEAFRYLVGEPRIFE
ncbi:MAG: hypothetical protein JW908_10655 [Anaerolineales bacterium]|nr:hypothetical protein [Anaerolineales bacterium]